MGCGMVEGGCLPKLTTDIPRCQSKWIGLSPLPHVRVDDFVARQADSTQRPERLVSEYLRVLKVMDLLGATLPAALADAISPLHDEPALHSPYV